MKKYIFILLLFSCIFLFSQQPQSMRAIATDGLLEGAWERIFDSVLLAEIDSTYFFTSFADYKVTINESDENAWEESERSLLEELPLGIAFANPYLDNLKHALFIRFSSTLNSSGSSENEEYLTEYLDTDDDDTYDLKYLTYTKSKDYDEDNHVFDFIWNNSYQLDILTFGLKFSSFTRKEQFDDADMTMGEADFDPLGYVGSVYGGANSKEMSYEFYYLPENFMYYKGEEDGDFVTEVTDDCKILELSCQLERSKSAQLKFGIGYEMHNDLRRDINDKLQATFIYHQPYDSLTYNGSLNETYKERITTDSNDLYLNTRYRKYSESEFAGEKGFWELALQTGYLFGDIEDYSEENLIRTSYWTDTVDTLSISELNECRTNGSKGDYTGYNVKAAAKYIIPFNPDACFAFGASYDFISKNKQLDYSYDRDKLTTYVNGDFDEEEDYIQTITEFYATDKETIVNQSEFRFPTAIEFKFPQSQLSANDGFSLRNFIFRLGSVYVLDDYYSESTHKVTSSEPYKQITEFGNGEIGEVHNNENTLYSSKSTTHTIKSSKIFSFGCGYRHSRNVNIDFTASYNYDSDDYYLGLAFTLNK